MSLAENPAKAQENLKAPGPHGGDNLLEILHGHKKMLKMKVGPQSLLKTKGQKKWSSEFTENKQVILFFLLLYDMQGVSSNFCRGMLG